MSKGKINRPYDKEGRRRKYERNTYGQTLMKAVGADERTWMKKMNWRNHENLVALGWHETSIANRISSFVNGLVNNSSMVVRHGGEYSEIVPAEKKKNYRRHKKKIWRSSVAWFLSRTNSSVDLSFWFSGSRKANDKISQYVGMDSLFAHVLPFASDISSDASFAPFASLHRHEHLFAIMKDNVDRHGNNGD